VFTVGVLPFDVGSMPPEGNKVRARPIRQELWEHAKKEFERMLTYFYVIDNTATYAAPLVIAPKKTPPYIRFCGDYRWINNYIAVPPVPIPIVHHELDKAKKFRVYLDIDMTNSFHQIPLTETASKLLSEQTPWGLVRPRFLPEGVGPASGMLQSIVREIFKDYADWTIVIFDNFLVLAHDFDDAYDKLKLVLEQRAAGASQRRTRASADFGDNEDKFFTWLSTRRCTRQWRQATWCACRRWWQRGSTSKRDRGR